MSDYWDVGSFKKKKSGGAYFVRLGSAKQRDDGGFAMWLDALPAPGESGQYEIQVVPQRERGNKPPPRDLQVVPQRERGNKPPPRDLDDSIPF